MTAPSSNRNAYRDLELPNFATVPEIRRQYKKLALKYHPDRGGDKDKMQVINMAHEFLIKNKEKYDRMLRGVPLQPAYTIIPGWRFDGGTTSGAGFSFSFTTSAG